MSSIRKIQLVAMSENDRMVFSSLLSLLSFKTSFTCRIVEQEADIAVVDIDNLDGQKMASKFEQEGQRIIKLSATPQHSVGGTWMNKPLRAAGILDSLNNAFDDLSEETPQSYSSSDQVKVVKLKRWPPKQVLGEFPKASRLCAVFMNHAISIEKAASLVGVNASIANHFVARCDEFGCIDQRSISMAPISELDTNKNASLFSKIRLKLGAR